VQFPLSTDQGWQDKRLASSLRQPSWQFSASGLNDAWSDNWGFVPLTDAEIAYAGRKLKSIIFKAWFIVSPSAVPSAMRSAI